MTKKVYIGKILTLEEPMYAEAVLVEGDTIIAVGNKQEILQQAGEDAQRIELGSRLLMPAFIDAHSHFSACANGLFQIPLGEAISFEEIQQKIADHIRENHIQPGEFVIGQGYDHNHLAEKAHPTKEILDKVSPENPVILQHQSGHMGVLNSKALEKFGITSDTQPPEGGLIEVKDGNLTGYLEETAFMQCLKAAPMPSMEQLLEAFDKTQKMYASYGITTIQEGMLVAELAQLYQPLLQQNRLWLDIVGYGDLQAADTLRNMFADNIGKYENHFRLGGYKIFLDGSPQGRTAWMLQAYKNAEDGYCGYPTMTDQQVEQAVARAAKDNIQILAHCNGDAAAEQYVSAVEKVYAYDKNVANIKAVIVHAQLTTETQLKRAKKLGMMPSFFVAHVYHWGDVHIENFGKERAEKISIAGTAKKLGIPFTFHQDSPVIPPNMLETIWCAVQRRTKNGVELGADERITVLDAIKAVTISAAYQYSEQDRKGSIKAGKKADFVILSENPLEIEPEGIREIQVLETIKDGKTVFCLEN